MNIDYTTLGKDAYVIICIIYIVSSAFYEGLVQSRFLNFWYYSDLFNSLSFIYITLHITITISGHVIFDNIQY